MIYQNRIYSNKQELPFGVHAKMIKEPYLYYPQFLRKPERKSLTPYPRQTTTSSSFYCDLNKKSIMIILLLQIIIFKSACISYQI